MDIPVPIKDPEEMNEVNDLKEEDKNKNIVKEEKNEFINFQNINSPQLIQDILHLSSHSTQNGFQHQNNLIKSLYSFNDSILPILEGDFSEDDINFNPRIIFLKKRNKLNMMNFVQINTGNNFLLKKINQYNDLKQKISDFKSLENKEKKINDDNQEENKKELNLKLFLVNHPLINLFKDEIDIIKLKDEIKNEYVKGMKDNTNYKPGPPNPHLINILEQNVSVSEENENENNDESEILSINSGEGSEQLEVDMYDDHQEEEDEDHGIEIVPNPNNQAQVNENHENIDENQNIQQEQEQPNLPNNINNEIQINIEYPLNEIQPIQPPQHLAPMQPPQPLPLVPLFPQIEQLEQEQPPQPLPPVPLFPKIEQLEPEQPVHPLEQLFIVNQDFHGHNTNDEEQQNNNIEENIENENINEIQHGENQNNNENINHNVEENKENNE